MKRNVIIGSIIIGVIAAILGWYLWNKQQSTTWQNDQFRFTIERPTAWQIDTITEEEKKDTLLFRAYVDAMQQENGLFTIRYEEGLRQVAALLHQDALTVILGNADRTFPQKYPSYTKISEKRITQNGHTGAEVYFSYTGPQGSAITERFMILMKDDNTAMYFIAQAPTENFEKKNNRYFNKIMESIEFY